MPRQFNPEHLPILALARADVTLEGEQTLASLQRLALEHVGAPAGRSVHWKAHAELRDTEAGAGSCWLHLDASAALAMVCQRCLALAEVPLQVDRWFRFVADETAAAAEDDDSEEDLLALADDFDLLALLEDELLLALPLIARHDACPVEPRMAVADAQFDAAAPATAAKPFAALAAWKSASPREKG